jgi:hypothetical protein
VLLSEAVKSRTELNRIWGDVELGEEAPHSYVGRVRARRFGARADGLTRIGVDFDDPGETSLELDAGACDHPEKNSSVPSFLL